MFDPKELLNVLTGGNPGSHAEAAAAAANDALERGKQVATGAANQTAAAVSSALGKAQDRLQGTEAAAYLGKAKEIVGQNPVGTTAALGGLAAILLGTQGGRAVTGSAVKLGGLAAIGGLAYNALRNYQEGRPLTAGVPGLEQLTAAPSGSGFSEEAHTNESALLLVRAMVATAASDGVVELSQRVKIVGELKDGALTRKPRSFSTLKYSIRPRSKKSRRASDHRRSSLSRFTQRRISSPRPSRKCASLSILPQR
jgi:uncharacterized membrane protein YebE (DUF533 family)